MPAIMRRTPTTEEASSYGYIDFLKDVVQKTVADTTAGFKRPIDFSDEEIMEMAFAGVGGGTKISKGLGKGKFPFDLKETGFPVWDNLLRKPAYHKKAKGVTRRIDFMSPREYFDLIEKKTSFSRDVGHRAESFANLEDVAKYAKKMRQGAKFPMPGLEYRGVGKEFYQEGRHRMLAAEKLGIDRVPVLIVRELEKAAAKVPTDPIKGILKKYKSQGLTYDAFVNQLPDKPQFAYHQWTFRGKGPLARATVTTKGTSLDEFEEMVADRIRKFAKPMVTSADVRPLRPSLPDPITGAEMTKFRVRPGGRHSWKAENPVQTKLDREVVEGRIQPGKWKSEVREDEITGYIVEGYNPKTNKWLWFNTEDTWLAAEQAVKRSETLLKKGGR